MNELTNEMIYEMTHTFNWGYEIKWSYDPRSYERNFSNKNFFTRRDFFIDGDVESCLSTHNNILSWNFQLSCDFKRSQTIVDPSRSAIITEDAKKAVISKVLVNG